MTNIFNNPNNFNGVGTPKFSNSFQFDDPTQMGRFAKQLSHNGGVSGVNQTTRDTMSVDCISAIFLVLQLSLGGRKANSSRSGAKTIQKNLREFCLVEIYYTKRLKIISTTKI